MLCYIYTHILICVIVKTVNAYAHISICIYRNVDGWRLNKLKMTTFVPPIVPWLHGTHSSPGGGVRPPRDPRWLLPSHHGAYQPGGLGDTRCLE